MEEEQQYLANAEIKKAEGEKNAAILRAEGRAEEIRLVQQQLTRSPNYIELVNGKVMRMEKGLHLEKIMYLVLELLVFKGIK